MNNLTWERLFGFRHAFDDPVTVALSIAIVALLVLAPVVILVMTRAANVTAERTKELWDRYRSWIWSAQTKRSAVLSVNPVSGFWLVSPELRNRPVSVPDAVGRGRRSRRHCLRISIQARDRLDESRRSRPIHLMECGTESATAMN